MPAVGKTIAARGEPWPRPRRTASRPRRPGSRRARAQGRVPPSRDGSKIGGTAIGRNQNISAKQQGMESRIARGTQPRRAQMGVGITGQEGRLVEHHARVPDARRPSQDGKDHLADHGLDREEQAEPPGTSCVPNSQANAEILMRSLHSGWDPTNPPPSAGFRLVDLDRSSTIPGKGRDASGAGSASPPDAGAESREGRSLSLHRRIGSRLRFREYLRAYRERIGRSRARARCRWAKHLAPLRRE